MAGTQGSLARRTPMAHAHHHFPDSDCPPCVTVRDSASHGNRGRSCTDPVEPGTRAHSYRELWGLITHNWSVISCSFLIAHHPSPKTSRSALPTVLLIHETTILSI